MNIHPNTVRYRVRRATEVSGLSFANPPNASPHLLLQDLG
ncbi:helix-turn-helix domain-containing protein [Actinophytocola sp.]|nr:helix-turn-helix domain-containing protein [Actinophytocola sp.]